MKSGFAQRDITPPVGTWIQGFGARDHASVGIRDPLCVQAAAFEDGGRRVLVVSADIVSYHPASVDRIREAVLRSTGVDRDHLLLLGTHTHSGSSVSDLRGMGDAGEAVRRDLEEKTAACAAEACRALRPALLSVASAPVAGIGYVREGPDAGGGERDPDLVLLAARSTDSGALLGLLWSFACHAVTLTQDNYLVSADFPGAARREIRRSHDVPVLFLQGACGDINPVSFRPGFWSGRTPDPSGETDRMGRVLAAEVKRLLVSAPFAEASGVAGAAGEAQLPVVRPLRGELEETLRKERAWTSSAAAAGAAYAYHNTNRIVVRWTEETIGLLDAGAYPSTVACPVHALRVGPVLILAAGAEVFSRTGLALRAAYGRGATFFAGYADGCIGYVPAEADRDSCSYAAQASARWYGRPVLAPGAETALMDGVRAAADRIAQGSAVS